MQSDLAHVVVGEIEQQRTLRSLALAEELAQRVGIPSSRRRVPRFTARSAAGATAW